ncbi:hypothetical protein CAPTEDRAFT_30221, partial [Capitella teleta]
PVLIGLFQGNKKPFPVASYLEDFLNEYRLLKDHGLTFQDKSFGVAIKAFVCDAPARAFLKGTKYHSGFDSCERCIIKGETINRRVTMISPNPLPTRNDRDFHDMMYYGKHQVARSPLVDYDIECVMRFPLDYMHMICLGVVRRLLFFLRSGPRRCKLSSRQFQEISKNLEDLRGKLPSEFARQPRSLSELERWKATEFRQFVLYTGVIVLKDVVSKAIYQHFLCLKVAVSI